MAVFRFLRTNDGHYEAEESASPSARYDFWRGELDLTDVKETDTDRELRSFFHKFAASPKSFQDRMRAVMYPKCGVELRWHPLRTAALALKSRDLRWITSGLTAIVATDSSRVPPEFSAGALAFLFNIGARVAPDDASVFLRTAAEMADGPRARIIFEFLQLPSETKQERFAAFETEVQTVDGVGFIMTGDGKYQPSNDLGQLIVRIRKVIASDRYEPQIISINTTIGDSRFRIYSRGAHPVPQFERGTELADALSNIRGTAAIIARLRPQYSPCSDAHSLSVGLIECSDIRTREFLCNRLDNNPILGAFVYLFADRLICRIGAASHRPEQAYENRETLARFRLPLEAILESLHTLDPE